MAWVPKVGEKMTLVIKTTVAILDIGTFKHQWGDGWADG